MKGYLNIIQYPQTTRGNPPRYTFVTIGFVKRVNGFVTQLLQSPPAVIKLGISNSGFIRVSFITACGHISYRISHISRSVSRASRASASQHLREQNGANFVGVWMGWSQWGQSSCMGFSVVLAVFIILPHPLKALLANLVLLLYRSPQLDAALAVGGPVTADFGFLDYHSSPPKYP